MKKSTPLVGSSSDTRKKFVFGRWHALFLLASLSVASSLNCELSSQAVGQRSVGESFAQCPKISVECPENIDQGTPITCTATVTDGPTSIKPTYDWSVVLGFITSGRGTAAITIDTTGLGGQTVTATVEVGGYGPNCNRSASDSTVVNAGLNPPAKFDEYGSIRFNDEKARLDNYAIQLQNEPGAQGYIIGYGSCSAEGVSRANRAKDYLVNTRGIDAGRIVAVDGGCMAKLVVELWVVPQGANAPTGNVVGVVSPCPKCKTRPTRRRGSRKTRPDLQ